MPASPTPMPTSVPEPAPARKPRKARKSKPTAERKPREKPARTLRVRVAELGPTHLDALDLMVKREPDFIEKVRDALDATDLAVEKHVALVKAHHELKAAEQRVADCQAHLDETKGALARLEVVAKSLAHALGDIPDAEDDELHRAAHPEDFAPARSEDE